MTPELRNIDDLPRQNASQVKNKWGEIVRQVRQDHVVAITNHGTIEMVLLDAVVYRQLVDQAQAKKSKEQQVLDELNERFRLQTAALNTPDVGDKLDAMFKARGKLGSLGKRSKAGASF